MIKRFHITLGAGTTAGGSVTSASSFISIDGVKGALDGDKVWCTACNTEGTIALDGPRLSATFNGKQVALHDDLCICRCTPPPRLVATQSHAWQTIDTDWHAARSAAVAGTAATLNAAPDRVGSDDDMPLVLLDPETQAPLAQRPYRLELGSAVIEGTTDWAGATKPLTSEQRAAVTAWSFGQDSSS